MTLCTMYIALTDGSRNLKMENLCISQIKNV